MPPPQLRISVPDVSWLATFADLADTGVEVVVWDVTETQPDFWIDLVLLPYGAVIDELRAMDPSRIGVVQSQALGYDGVREALPAGATYANAVGVHESNTAELALALTLASQRRLDEFARQQTTGGWDRPWGAGLVDRTVVLIGVGGIGTQIYRRLQGFDCEVIRVGGRERHDDHGIIQASTDLPDLLPRADVVIIALPLTPDTRGLVDDTFLNSLRDDALVVNVARGAITDTDAVLRQKGRVRYATDVVDVEPVPADHPLRHAPGVFLTPHIGGRSCAQRPRVEQLVRRQVANLLSGADLENVLFAPATGKRIALNR